MQRRYGALRAIATLYKIIGIIIFVLALLAAIFACLGLVLGDATLRGLAQQFGAPLGLPLANLAMVAVGLLYALILGLALYAFGEAIFVFLAIEENTRLTSMVLDRQMALAERDYPPPMP
jgi:hypothetical protein